MIRFVFGWRLVFRWFDCWVFFGLMFGLTWCLLELDFLSLCFRYLNIGC